MSDCHASGPGAEELPIIIVPEGQLTISHANVLTLATEFYGRLALQTISAGVCSIYIRFDTMADARGFLQLLKSYRKSTPAQNAHL